jgi:hypothetical protein
MGGADKTYEITRVCHLTFGMTLKSAKLL